MVHYLAPQQLLHEHRLETKNRQKWLALHWNNTQRNYQTTQKLCIYTKKIFQTTSVRLTQLVSVYVKYYLKSERKKPAFIIGDDEKSFRTDHHWKLCSALSVYNLNMVICKAIQSFQFRDLKNTFLSVRNFLH